MNAGRPKLLCVEMSRIEQNLNHDPTPPRGCIAAFVVLFAMIVVGALGGVWYSIRFTSSLVRDAYASDWTTEFLLLHLKANDNQWPKSWEDLRDEHASRYPSSCPFTLIEIQDRVELRFDIDTAKVVDSEPPTEFLRLKSGTGANFNGEPNERINQYLLTSLKKDTAQEQY